MNDNKFRFKKNDIEIELSGEKEYLESQISYWKSFIEKLSFGEDAITKEKDFLDKEKNLVDITNNHNEIKVTKNISLEDFFELKKPENDTERVIVAAYYLERYDKYEHFSELDLYRILNISNIENHLLINMENGYLSLAGNKNNINFYTLTYSGEIYVREGIEAL